MSNEPSSRVSSAMKTACRRKSPSSSTSAVRSSRSMASTTSYDSSITNGFRLGSVCLRSHGQPSGPRSLCISCTRSSKVRFGMQVILSGENLGGSICGDSAASSSMSNQVLIVASEAAAKAPADIATSLSLTPVVTGSEQEALDLLDHQTFALIAVSGGEPWQRLRDEVERKQPATRLLELPETNGDDGAMRRLMIRYLDRRARPKHFSSEERYRFLSNILESFTGTLELKEVLRRIVSITRQEFCADRAWLLHPVNEQAEFAKVRFAVSAPAYSVQPDQYPPGW